MKTSIEFLSGLQRFLTILKLNFYKRMDFESVTSSLSLEPGAIYVKLTFSSFLLLFVFFIRKLMSSCDSWPLSSLLFL